MRLRKTRCLIAIALMVAGCQTPDPTGTQTVPRRPIMTPHASPTGTASLPPTTPTTDPTRIVDSGSAVELIGKVKLISNNGGSVVDASTLISDKGLGIISNNGSGYRVLAAGLNEASLANATIEVLDGDGKVLVDKNGAPIGAKSDATGSYTLSATLPDENLWLRVSLPDGNQLAALLVRNGGTGQQTLDIDTASTLGATYVLQEYVQNNKTVYARLPGTDAQKLLDDTIVAEAQLTSLPSYKPSNIIAATDALRAKNTTLDTELTHIKDILLLGQTDLGSGLQANKVPLTSPNALYQDAAGNVYIEENIGRIRKVDPNGQISLYAGIGTGAKAVSGTLGIIEDMVGKPDATLYLACTYDDVVRMISASGQLTTVAGGGTDTSGNGKATDEKLNTPHRLALGPDGSLYILEQATASASSRLLKVDTSGNMTVLPALTTDGTIANGYGLAVTSDGTIYAARSLGTDHHDKEIVCLPPGATTWQTYYAGLDSVENEKMRLGDDGALYLPSEADNEVLRFDLSVKLAKPEIVATGSAATFQEPDDVLEFKGSQLILSEGNASVYSLAPSGTPQLFAGAQGINQIGNALGLALNAPGGICADGSGNLVFSEDGSNSIKRLNGNQLELVAGGKSGQQDGIGAAAQFARPTGIAYHGGVIYVADSNNYKVRAIAADRTVTTLLGAGKSGGITQKLTPAAQATFGRISGITVDPQGRVWFSDTVNHQILRLDSDGNVELVAGAPVANGQGTHDYKGDGGPASQALVYSPTGMACDKAGDIYFADTGNLCVRKIDTQGNISTVAGVAGSSAELKLISGQTDSGDVSASQALIVGPSGLCLDAAGNLYISELGSAALTAASGAAGGSAMNIGFTLPTIPARIRKLSVDGETVSIVAGPGGKVMTEPNADDALFSPTGLAIDGQGRLAIVDALIDQVKILPAGSF